jgi:hypothetical protein
MAKFLTPIVYPVLSSTPQATTGATYYDTRYKAIMLYDGINWQALSMISERYYPEDVDGGVSNSTYIESETLAGITAIGTISVILDGGYILT